MRIRPGILILSLSLGLLVASVALAQEPKRPLGASDISTTARLRRGVARGPVFRRSSAERECARARLAAAAR